MAMTGATSLHLRTDDRVAKSRACGESPAAAFFVAPPVRARFGPTGNEPSVGRLGLLDPSTLLIAMAPDVIGVSCRATRQTDPLTP